VPKPHPVRRGLCGTSDVSLCAHSTKQPGQPVRLTTESMADIARIRDEYVGPRFVCCYHSRVWEANSLRSCLGGRKPQGC
jgi:hypothetical protein